MKLLSDVMSLKKINKIGLKTVLNSFLICLFSPNAGYGMGVLRLSNGNISSKKK